MPATAVKRDILLPVFVTIQAGEPDPFASLLRHVHVGVMPQRLQREAAEVVNDDGGVGPVVGRCKRKSPLLDFHGHQGHGIRRIHMVLILVMILYHQLLPMAGGSAARPDLFDPPAFRRLPAEQGAAELSPAST